MKQAALRALCLAGPTASGKTALALALAREVPLEIISVDSALVYRGMDIGTAKPGIDERGAVPHHLIDIIEPTHAYSAARFVADANRLIDDIHSRGRLPLLVGGTMLYFKALREGLDTMPAADAALRTQIEADATVRGWPALHADLARVDPAIAARLAPNDSQRIQRALEVFSLSGRPLSTWQKAVAAARTANPVLPLLSLEGATREELHQRIAQRFDSMLARGFVDEVRKLRQRGDLHAELPAMRCVGYRQAWAALDAGAPVDMGRLRDTGIAATRQLAKRQLTWLRSMTDRQPLAGDSRDQLEQALEALRRTGWH